MNAGQPIVVVGAGIVGVATAIWLQREGHDVCLIDREGPAAGTSYGNGGVLAASAIIPVTVPGLLRKAPGMLMDADSPLFMRWSYLPKLLPWLFRYLKHGNETDVRRIASALTYVLKDSLDQHQALAAETPAAQYIEPSDYVFLYDNKAGFDGDKMGFDIRAEHGHPFETMNADQLAEYDPTYAGKFGYAVRMLEHGTITDPGKYVQALAQHLEHQGGTVMTANVSEIEYAEQGGSKRAVAVKTDQGRVECAELVITAGAWSGPLARQLGVDVPLESERGYHIEFVNASVKPRAPVMIAAKKFVITPMQGRIRCAGIVEFGGLDAAPSRGPIELLKRNALEALPEMTYERIDEWMGHRPAPSDSIPLIGPAPAVENAYMGFGHHHIGLTGGPITGRMVAGQITGKKLNFDMAPYAPKRFS